MPFRFAIDAANFLIFAVGGRSLSPSVFSTGTAASPYGTPRGNPADDAPGAVAHRVDRIHHLLPAGQHVVEKAFQLRRHAGIDQRRIGALQNAEQGKSVFGRHDVLPLRSQEPLPLQPRNDLRSRRRRADPLRLAQPVSQRLVFDEPPRILLLRARC